MYITYHFNVDWSIHVYHSIMYNLFQNYRQNLGNFGRAFWENPTWNFGSFWGILGSCLLVRIGSLLEHTNSYLKVYPIVSTLHLRKVPVIIWTQASVLCWVVDPFSKIFALPNTLHPTQTVQCVYPIYGFSNLCKMSARKSGISHLCSLPIWPRSKTKTHFINFGVKWQPWAQHRDPWVHSTQLKL